MATLDKPQDALKGCGVRPLAVEAVLVANRHLVVVPVKHGLLRFGRQLVPWGVHGEAHIVCNGLQEPSEVITDVTTRPRSNRSIAQGQGRVRNDQFGINDHANAQPRALRAGAKG